MADLPALRRQMLQTAFFAQEGHLPSSFSVLEILDAIYSVKTDADRVVLSKGHAALALYTILADRGLIPEFWWHRFCQPGSIYEGHPNHAIPGVEFSTGSLGMGIGMAAGLALGLKIQNLPGRVFCVVGDEECNEGSVWETALLAYKLRLNNLVVVVDDNRSSPLPMQSIGDKFRAFGWQTMQAKGHDIRDLVTSLSFVSESLPTTIIASTVKGYGCPPLQDKAWHHRSPKSDEMAALLGAVQ